MNDNLDQTSVEEKEFKKKKYDDQIELLVSAGYFRARIATLSEFDKVIGGLCWCITSSGDDVDVDILFQENSTIGQKIKLSESIVHALRKMKCPHSLQAYQIQGSDFAATHPVITWLLQRFFSNREATKHKLREFASFQFSKNFDCIAKDTPLSRGGLLMLKEQAKVERRYRLRAREMRRDSEESRVHSCLVEYGDHVTLSPISTSNDSHEAFGSSKDGSTTENSLFLSSSSTVTGKANSVSHHATSFSSGMTDLTNSANGELSSFERELLRVHVLAMKEEESYNLKLDKEREDLLQNMTTAEKSQTIAGSHVGKIIVSQSQEIGEAIAIHDSVIKKREDAEGGALGQAGGIVGATSRSGISKRQINALDKQLRKLNIDLEGIAGSLKSSSEPIESVVTQKSELAEYCKKLMSEIARLDEIEGRVDRKSDLTKLKELVELNESFKRQETDFKESCKRQIVSLQSELENCSKVDEDSKLQEIESSHAKVMAKHDRLRQLLADRNLAVASSLRQVDDIPNRTELVQYERRFHELYQQVSWKLGENRRYVDVYNSLNRVCDEMSIQVKLVNSIGDNLGVALSGTEQKEAFLQQFGHIVRGVEEGSRSAGTMEKTRKEKVESARGRYSGLVQRQRRYFGVVKEFRDECNLSERLSARLVQLNEGNVET